MSTIIRKARDENLWDGDGSHHDINKEQFSCFSIQRALEDYGFSIKVEINLLDKIERKLIEFGCNIDVGNLFDNFHTTEKEQKARFVWLSFVIEATKNVKLKL